MDKEITIINNKILTTKSKNQQILDQMIEDNIDNNHNHLIIIIIEIMITDKMIKIIKITILNKKKYNLNLDLNL